MPDPTVTHLHHVIAIPDSTGPMERCAIMRAVEVLELASRTWEEQPHVRISLIESEDANVYAVACVKCSCKGGQHYEFGARRLCALFVCTPAYEAELLGRFSQTAELVPAAHVLRMPTA